MGIIEIRIIQHIGFSLTKSVSEGFMLGIPRCIRVSRSPPHWGQLPFAFSFRSKSLSYHLIQKKAFLTRSELVVIII